MPDVLPRFLARLDGLAKLPPGWHYGSGVPSDPCASIAARQAAWALHDAGAEGLEAFPGEDGSVLVCGYRGPRTASVCCRPDGLYDLSLEDDAGGPEEEHWDVGAESLTGFYARAFPPPPVEAAPSASTLVTDPVS